MVSCANSHSLNFGEEGLLLQNRYLDAAKIVHAGTGENLRQASSPDYLETSNGRVALIAATAHLPSESNRAANQRVDFRGKPGVNALGFARPSALMPKRLPPSCGLPQRWDSTESGVERSSAAFTPRRSWHYRRDRA